MIRSLVSTALAFALLGCNPNEPVTDAAGDGPLRTGDAIPDDSGATPDDSDATPDDSDAIPDDSDAIPDDSDAIRDAMPPADAGLPPPHPWIDHPLLAPGPLVIAHRGGRRIAPESTLVAYDMAWRGGVDVLEGDLHATADGEVVVLHDSTVDRTTDGTGRVRELTLDELRALDAGARFREGDGAPYRGMGLMIPTLDELLTAFPDAPFSLEIKQTDPPIVEAVIALLDAHEARGRVVISAFPDHTIEALRAAAPDLLTTMALGEIVAWMTLPPGPDARPWQPGGHILQVPLEQAGFDLVTKASVRHADRHGVRVQPWTINDPDEMRRLLDLGVHGIITDDPFVLRDLIESRR